MAGSVPTPKFTRTAQSLCAFCLLLFFLIVRVVLHLLPRLRRPMTDHRKANGQHNHENPNKMTTEDTTSDTSGEQTREQRRTERPYAADQRERDGVQRPQDSWTRAHVVQDELDGCETHRDTAAQHQRRGCDGPEHGGHALAQENVAYGEEGEEERVRVGADAHNTRGADAGLEPGEHDQKIQGLREAAEHHEDTDSEGREPEPAQVDGGEKEDGDDGRVGEGEDHDVCVDVEGHGDVGRPEEF